MAAKNSFSVNAEYIALRFFCALVNAIPYRLAMAMARFLGWFAVRAFGYRRERTRQRIRAAFPGRTPREVDAIAVRSLQNILQTGVEMIRAPRLTRRWMDRWVVDGARYKDMLQTLVDEGRGVVIMVPHSGNWYMAAWSMAKYGLRLCAIAAKQRNPKVDAWMKRQYGDIDILDRGSAKTMVEIKRMLATGRAFAILPDLRVPMEDVEVDFLGGKANVSHGGAMFAVHAGCPIVVAVMRRENGRHVFDYIGLLRPDPEAADRKEEARRLTREAMTLIDVKLREHPGDWFWYNKRWILQPPKRAKAKIRNRGI